MDFIVIEGLRTVDRQKTLVAEGKSRTMNSRHLTGHAVDLLPIDPADGRGKFDWPLYHMLAPAVKLAAQREGVQITWGGDWKSFRDGPHFELERNAYPVGAPFDGQPLPTKPVVVNEPAQSDTQRWLAGLLAFVRAWPRKG